MILYLKDPKNSTKKFLDLMNTFNNITGYKINVQNPTAFVCKIMSKLRKKSGK
jgi:hypothetical protein